MAEGDLVSPSAVSGQMDQKVGVTRPVPAIFWWPLV